MGQPVVTQGPDFLGNLANAFIETGIRDRQIAIQLMQENRFREQQKFNNSLTVLGVVAGQLPEGTPASQIVEAMPGLRKDFANVYGEENVDGVLALPLAKETLASFTEDSVMRFLKDPANSEFVADLTELAGGRAFTGDPTNALQLSIQDKTNTLLNQGFDALNSDPRSSQIAYTIARRAMNLDEEIRLTDPVTGEPMQVKNPETGEMVDLVFDTQEAASIWVQWMGSIQSGYDMKRIESSSDFIAGEFAKKGIVINPRLLDRMQLAQGTTIPAGSQVEFNGQERTLARDVNGLEWMALTSDDPNLQIAYRTLLQGVFPTIEGAAQMKLMVDPNFQAERDQLSVLNLPTSNVPSKDRPEALNDIFKSMREKDPSIGYGGGALPGTGSGFLKFVGTIGAGGAVTAVQAIGERAKGLGQRAAGGGTQQAPQGEVAAPNLESLFVPIGPTPEATPASVSESALDPNNPEHVKMAREMLRSGEATVRQFRNEGVGEDFIRAITIGGPQRQGRNRVSILNVRDDLRRAPARTLKLLADIAKKFGTTIDIPEVSGAPKVEPKAESNFTSAVNFVLENEGGFNPRDRGGNTNFGISQQAHPDVDVTKLRREDAIKMYRDRYWIPMGFKGVNDTDKARVFFDSAIQFSPTTFGRLVQGALAEVGITTDSTWGKDQIAALNRAPKDAVLRAFAKQRIRFFVERSAEDEFIRSRLPGLLKRARRL